MARPNYYEILCVSPTASYDDIKKSYQTLVLKFHPDKTNTGSDQAFIEIDEAWKVLRNPEERKKYDAEMGQARFDDKPIVHETLRKSEFSYDEESDVYYRDCRCGGVYVIPEDQTEIEESIYIACDECSLVIELEKE